MVKVSGTLVLRLVTSNETIILSVCVDCWILSDKIERILDDVWAVDKQC
jgi:hypothetical protein